MVIVSILSYHGSRLLWQKCKTHNKCMLWKLWISGTCWGEERYCTHKETTFNWQRTWTVLFLYMLHWERRLRKESQIETHALYFKVFVFQLFVGQLDIYLANCLSTCMQLSMCVLNRQHVTKKRGRFCWRVTDAGLQSCIMLFRMTITWYLWTCQLIIFGTCTVLILYALLVYSICYI